MLCYDLRELSSNTFSCQRLVPGAHPHARSNVPQSVTARFRELGLGSPMTYANLRRTYQDHRPNMRSWEYGFGRLFTPRLVARAHNGRELWIRG